MRHKDVASNTTIDDRASNDQSDEEPRRPVVGALGLRPTQPSHDCLRGLQSGARAARLRAPNRRPSPLRRFLRRPEVSTARGRNVGPVRPETVSDPGVAIRCEYVLAAVGHRVSRAVSLLLGSPVILRESRTRRSGCSEKQRHRKLHDFHLVPPSAAAPNHGRQILGRQR